MMKWNDLAGVHLPSSQSLRSFLAAARHGSFSEAGRAVGLTQSAISRQISQLEARLGVPLFVRAGRRVELNAAGRAYAEAVEPALAQIVRASARLGEQRGDNSLTIACLPSLGMRWLAPRLPRLSARHPELVINIAARSWPFGKDEEAGEFDAVFDFGQPPWPGMNHAFLFREEAVPVCAPGWLEANPLERPADLADKPLLFQSSRPKAWDQWFAACGVELARPCEGPRIGHFLMLAQAAEAGAGVALIPSFLIEAELAAGSLVVPFETALSTRDAYHLVWRGDLERGSSLGRFVAWVRDEAAVPTPT